MTRFSLLVSFLLAFSPAATLALTTPHVAERALHSRHHAHIAARHANVEDTTLTKKSESLRLRKRCKRPTRSSSAAPAPTPPVNVAPPPPPPAQEPPKEPPKDTPKPPPPPPPPKNEPKPPPPKDDPKPPPPKDDPKPPPSNVPDILKGVKTGEGTFYATGLGACGLTNNDNDMIAAVSQHLFDVFPGYKGGNPNKNPICGRSVTVRFEGKTINVKLVDRCVGCRIWDLDFSPTAFNKIANPDRGRIQGIQWTFD